MRVEFKRTAANFQVWAGLHNDAGTPTVYVLDQAAGLVQVLSDGSYTYLYGNDRLAQQSTSETEYFLTDALGSVRQLTNSDGEITLNRSYDPYGNVLASSGDGVSTFAFTGEQVDIYSNLLYLRARYYSTATGRFMSRDTWQGDANQPMSYNPWLFGFANPTKYYDPTGKTTVIRNLGIYTNEVGASDWQSDEINTVEGALLDIANAYANAYRDELIRRFFEEGCNPYGNLIYFIQHQILNSPNSTFLRLHKGRVTFRRKASSVSWWGEDISSQEIWVYQNVRARDVATNPRFIVHEMGHAFENVLADTIKQEIGPTKYQQKGVGRFGLTKELWWRSYPEKDEKNGGFAGAFQDWQWSRNKGLYDDNGTPDYYKDDKDGRLDIFADMFTGWVYNQWEESKDKKNWSPTGTLRANYMGSNMPVWIFEAVSIRLGEGYSYR